MNNNNNTMIFRLCCIALTVTAMTFAIRAGILSELAQSYKLTDSQLGWINSMAFLGFPIATILGGIFYNKLGARTLLFIAFICHLLGLGLTIAATGFWSLLVSTFFIGFANGAVEAGCNPLVTELYRDQKTTMLNRFHVWFPGGIVIGALLSSALTKLSFDWTVQIAVMIPPTLLYGYMLLRYQIPQQSLQPGADRRNIRAIFSPLFLFMLLCMTLTATTELGTQQWINRILGASGASPMLIMALITGIMAIGRYFAGPLIKQFNATGVLLISAVLSTFGIFMMSQLTGALVYLSAVFFALGVTYFWPTMLGFIAEKKSETGALGLSLMGGAGMFAVSMYNPLIGQWIDTARAKATAEQVANVELVTGQSVLADMMIFPVTLIIAFTVLFVIQRKFSMAQSEQTTH